MDYGGVLSTHSLFWCIAFNIDITFRGSSVVLTPNRSFDTLFKASALSLCCGHEQYTLQLLGTGLTEEDDMTEKCCLGRKAP